MEENKENKNYKSILAVGEHGEICVFDYGNYPYTDSENDLREIFEEYYFDKGIDLPNEVGIYEFEYQYWEWSENTENGYEGDSGGELINCKKLYSFIK